MDSGSVTGLSSEGSRRLLRWDFPAQNPGITEYHDLPTREALDSDLETFVREVLQNANDQALNNDDPAEVTFEFKWIESYIEDFLRVLQWDGEGSDSLQWHIERANENEKTRDAGLKRFLNNFDGEKLLVLTIHDENTTGLRGGEDDSSSPYGALVKDFGSSEKPTSSSGGSYGLGKTVLWAFSGLSTVLFNSIPEDPGEGRTPPRIVGRSILPSHDHEDGVKTYTNHGWFGRNDSEERERLGRVPSLWEDEGPAADVAESLGVGREGRGYGTSIGVVGFRVPGGELDPDPNELADDFRHAAIKHFWPAISEGDLEVSVKTPDGDVQTAELSDAPAVKPFVRAYEKHFETDATELNKPGDIAKTGVELTVPRENRDVVDDPNEKYETAVDLLIRQLNPKDTDAFDQSDDPELGENHVSRLRGAEMIVDYVDKSNVAERGKNFAGVLVCGEAQAQAGEEPSEAQEAVEKFLKRSEPTQHDDWVGSNNEYLKKHYSGTIVSEISALSGERLEQALADIVHEDVDPGDEVADMDDVAPIMNGRSDDGQGAGSVMDWENDPSAWFEDSQWHFSGRGGPKEEHEGWSLEIRLDRLDADESQSDSIPITSLSPDPVSGPKVNYQKESVSVEVPSSINQIAIEGTSKEVIKPGTDVSEAFEVGEVTEVRLDVSAEVDTTSEE
jgi:hypothetical protein